MPKYSTGRGGGGHGGTDCELCGEPVDDLTEATIAGAQLAVCPDCAHHDETARSKHEEEPQTVTETVVTPADELDRESDGDSDE